MMDDGLACVCASCVQIGVLVGITGGRDVVLDAFMTPEVRSWF